MNEFISQLPLFPLGTVLFPGATLNLHIFEERYRLMIARCLSEQIPFGVVLLRSGDEVQEGRLSPAPAEPCTIGTTAQIGTNVLLEDGRYLLTAIGAQRFRIRQIIQRAPYITADVELWPDEFGLESNAAVEELRETYNQYWQAIMAATGNSIEAEKLPDDPSDMTLHLADRFQVNNERKQLWLETDITRRAREMSAVLRAELLLLPRSGADGSNNGKGNLGSLN